MKIAVFGLGYVGTVSAACLASLGHQVTGIDVRPEKVQMFAAGESPVSEFGLGAMLRDCHQQGRIRAAGNVDSALEGTEISIVCVGTPSLPNGSPDVSAVSHVVSQIAIALGPNVRHTVVVRSTVLPEALGGLETLLASTQARLIANPEFLREGTAVGDFFDPPFTVIGGRQAETMEQVGSLYEALDAPVHFTGLQEAAAIKFASNAFHATKVTFANEIGNWCSDLGVDSHAVMDIVCADTKLNISSTYLRPGYAYGGSCLPKDLRALVSARRRLGTTSPLLESLSVSNNAQMERALSIILDYGVDVVGLIGLAFKEGTDDVRESPLLWLAEQMVGKGVSLRIYDPFVLSGDLVGKNRAAASAALPHLERYLMGDLDEFLSGLQAVVVGAKHVPPERLVVTCQRQQIPMLDLVGIPDVPAAEIVYRGIAW